MSWLEDFFCGNKNKELKELRIEKNNLINDVNNLERKSSALNVLLELEEKDRQYWHGKEINCQLQLLKKNNFRIDLPSCFEKTLTTYKGNAFVSTKKGEFEWSYKKANDSMALSPFMDELIEKAKISGSDLPKTVFDKILGVEQKFVNYLLDIDQYGKSEVWNQPFFEWVTKAADCENSAIRVVSTFEYYQLLHGRFPNAFAFIGTGLFNRQFGHAFPCLLLNIHKPLIERFKDGVFTIDDDLFIGEATLNAVIPSRELSLVKNSYDLSWGCFNFFDSFKLKDELRWW